MDKIILIMITFSQVHLPDDSARKIVHTSKVSRGNRPRSLSRLSSGDDDMIQVDDPWNKDFRYTFFI